MEALITAIIHQACKDYKNPKMKKEVEEFFKGDICKNYLEMLGNGLTGEKILERLERGCKVNAR